MSYSANDYSLCNTAYDERNLRMAEAQTELYFQEMADNFNRVENLEYAYFEQFTGDDWFDFQPPIPL